MAYIRINQIAERLGGIHQSTVWRKLSADPRAPKAVRLGSRLTVFDEAEVERWIAGLVEAARRNPAPRKLPDTDAIRRGAATRKALRQAAK